MWFIYNVCIYITYTWKLHFWQMCIDHIGINMDQHHTTGLPSNHPLSIASSDFRRRTSGPAWVDLHVGQPQCWDLRGLWGPGSAPWCVDWGKRWGRGASTWRMLALGCPLCTQTFHFERLQNLKTGIGWTRWLNPKMIEGACWRRTIGLFWYYIHLYPCLMTFLQLLCAFFAQNQWIFLCSGLGEELDIRPWRAVLHLMSSSLSSDAIPNMSAFGPEKIVWPIEMPRKQ
jgi:hypothetical protein